MNNERIIFDAKQRSQYMKQDWHCRIHSLEREREKEREREREIAIQIKKERSACMGN